MGQGYYDSLHLCFYDREEAACAASVKLEVKRARMPQHIEAVFENRCSFPRHLCR